MTSSSLYEFAGRSSPNLNFEVQQNAKLLHLSLQSPVHMNGSEWNEKFYNSQLHFFIAKLNMADVPVYGSHASQLKELLCTIDFYQWHNTYVTSVVRL